MTNDAILSRAISYLRVPLTIGVVFIHFSLQRGLEIHGVFHGLNNPGWFFFIVNLMSEVIARLCVPTFFIISGFLFYYRCDFDQRVYQRKLRSRARSLLIPYLLWNLIAILWQLKCFLPIVSHYFRPVEIDLTLSRVINTFFFNSDNQGIFIGPAPSVPNPETYPIDGPFWYIRDLMVMVAASPIIYWLTKRIKALLPAVLFVLWIATPFLFPAGGYITMLITASFFFAWGAYYSIHHKSFVLQLSQLKYLGCIYPILAIADALTKGAPFNAYLHRAGIIFGIILIVSIAAGIVARGKDKTWQPLADSCFFIYALHGIIIGDIGKFLFTILHVPENNPYCMLALYFGTPVLCIAMSIGLHRMLKKYVPPISRVLNGGR